jgi:hypothetical protein
MSRAVPAGDFDDEAAGQGYEASGRPTRASPPWSTLSWVTLERW